MDTGFRSLAVCTALLAAAVGAAWAQPAPIKPGLWQMRMEHDDPEMSARIKEMETQMKSMPPETRKQVEAMMKQQGVDLSAPGTAKLCFTKEQLAQDSWQAHERSSGCKSQTTRSGSTWKFHTSCPAPQASETDGEVTFTSAERYTTKTTTRLTEGGQSKTMKMSATATWLGADCGSVKPIPPPSKK